MSLLLTPPDTYAYHSPTSLVKSLHKKPKKKTSSLNSQDSPMNSQLKKISPLASSKFQALPFGPPLLLQIPGTSASSLPAHFASHPFSHFAVEPC